MKLFAFPKSKYIYNELLYEELESTGVEVVEGIFSGRWLFRHAVRGDVAHLHWPSFEYAAPRAPALLYRFVRWALILLLLRARGIRVFWSAHNILPHDRSTIGLLDTLGRRLLIRMSEVIFVHGRHAAIRLLEVFPAATSKLRIVPHGHFIGYYPVSGDQRSARDALSLPQESYVYLFVGLCKPYKNLEGLIEAFRRIEGNAVLLIAGKFQSRSYEDMIRKHAEVDPRVMLCPGFIPDPDLHRFLLASDVVVAPYLETLTSGTAMLAMSFGRPIVSVALGHLLDVVTPDVGELYDPEQNCSLHRALEQVRRRKFDESAILEHARSFTYEEAARVLAACIESRAVPADSSAPIDARFLRRDGRKRKASASLRG